MSNSVRPHDTPPRSPRRAAADRPGSRRQRGFAMVWMAMALIPLVGIIGLAMQWAEISLAQAALQDYVDARAVSALKDAFGADVDVQDYADAGAIGAFLRDQDEEAPEAECGGWRHDDEEFDDSECPFATDVPAFRVAHEVEMDLVFGNFITALGGPATATIRAEATSFIPRRDVMLVQDISLSLGDIGPSQQALRAIVNTMEDQELPGDRVGLTVFGSEDEVELKIGLTPLAFNAGDVRSEIDDLELGSLTCTSGGIETGRAGMEPLAPDHEIYPLMIVITDGVPSDCGNGDDPAIAAVIAAQNACDAGIDVWAVPVGSNVDETILRQLVCTQSDEQVVPAASEAQVAAAVTEILTRIPVRLVE